MESALLLRLLEREGVAFPEQARVARFLAGQRQNSELFDRILVDCALGKSCDDSRNVVAEVLARAPSSLTGRKESLLAAILAIFDHRLPDVPPNVDTVNSDCLHTWAAVQMLAVKELLRSDRERTSPIAEAEIAVLKATQASASVWEGNILANLLVLHALAGDPSNAALVRAGIRRVLEHQRSDGGVPFVDNTDTWCTITAAAALATARAAPQVLSDLIADYLLTQQRVDGLWAYSELTTQTDLDDSSVCVRVLRAAKPSRVEMAIKHANARIAAMQGADGGFPTYVAGAPSDAYITAAVISALSVERDRYVTEIRDAVGFLVAVQSDDGTFGPDWSRSRFHTVYRVIDALARSGDASGADSRQMAHRARMAVLVGQNGDGGWGQQGGEASDAFSTAYALLALDRDQDRDRVVAGVEFLLLSRRPDGSIVSVPDMVGPRPFAIDLPVLADIYSLLALGHVSARIPEEGRAA